MRHEESQSAANSLALRFLYAENEAAGDYLHDNGAGGADYFPSRAAENGPQHHLLREAA